VKCVVTRCLRPGALCTHTINAAPVIAVFDRIAEAHGRGPVNDVDDRTRTRWLVDLWHELHADVIARHGA
jgi:hypothetical protein